MKEIDTDEVQISTLLKTFDLWEIRDNKISSFSLGMRKRVSIHSKFSSKVFILFQKRIKINIYAFKN